MTEGLHHAHMSDHRIVITEATEEIRERIYQARHRVYALEIGQHSPNAEGSLTDALDASNRYLVALHHGELAGFVSVTPPGDAGYSIDKYFTRDELPFLVDDGLFEIRLLTVLPGHRTSELAAALMLAAFRWIEVDVFEIRDDRFRSFGEGRGGHLRSAGRRDRSYSSEGGPENEAIGAHRVCCGLAAPSAASETGSVLSWRGLLRRDRCRLLVAGASVRDHQCRCARCVVSSGTGGD
jgi:hypothetical protein